MDNYDFSILIKKIPHERIIQIFEAMILEHKVILISEEYGDLAVII